MMIRRLFYVMLMAALPVAGFAQRPEPTAALFPEAKEQKDPVRVHSHRILPWQKSFSLEVGVGLNPLHMAFFPRRSEEEAMAERGQEYSSKSLNLPAFSLSAVWYTQERDEWVVSLGISRARYNVTQYSRFGWDPQGNPRYNLNEGVTIGPVSTPVVPTLNVLYRAFWNSNPTVTFYSAFGGGLIYMGSGKPALIPLPALTPVGMRAGGKHLYFYLETGLTPLSSLVHGGLGWRF